MISFIQSGYFYSASSSPLYYSEALLTQHGYCTGVSGRSSTCNCEWRTCPRSLHESGIRTRDPSDADFISYHRSLPPNFCSPTHFLTSLRQCRSLIGVTSKKFPSKLLTLQISSTIVI